MALYYKALGISRMTGYAAKLTFVLDIQMRDRYP